LGSRCWKRLGTLWERLLLSWHVFSKSKDGFAQSTQRAQREHRETPWERQLLVGRFPGNAGLCGSSRGKWLIIRPRDPLFVFHRSVSRPRGKKGRLRLDAALGNVWERQLLSWHILLILCVDVTAKPTIAVKPLNSCTQRKWIPLFLQKAERNRLQRKSKKPV
jgi:hypothetical protein